jgi:hypothetical protein
MSTTKTLALPKNIEALVKREAELQASVDKWSGEAFRAERDRLTDRVHSGNATDEEIKLHADFRDGGKIDADYQALQSSSIAALEAFRRTSWEAFREFLRARLEARRDREHAIAQDVEALRSGHGIQVDYSDPEASTTSQLASICASDSHGFIVFKNAEEIF